MTTKIWETFRCKNCDTFTSEYRSDFDMTLHCLWCHEYICDDCDCKCTFTGDIRRRTCEACCVRKHKHIRQLESHGVQDYELIIGTDSDETTDEEDSDDE